MFDKTKSGRIDLFGFSALWVFMQQWRQLFQQYDRDRSGCISGTELHQGEACVDGACVQYEGNLNCHLNIIFILTSPMT